MFKSLLVISAFVMSSMAHAYVCTAVGHTGAQGVGTSPFLPQAQMFALQYCQSYNFGVPCMLTGCTPFLMNEATQSEALVPMDNELMDDNSDDVDATVFLTGAAWGYGKDCNEAGQNALNKNRCYHGTKNWKELSCVDSRHMGKKAIVKYTCN